MAVFPVRLFGDPVLRENALEVIKVNGDVKALAGNMAQTMYTGAGIGLAAPQIGVLKQVIVIDMGGDNFVVYLNPRIREHSKKGEVDDEGCLCLPEIRVPVRRYTRVVVDALDLKGRPVEIEADDLLARVLQHEIDHLLGKTILDKTDKKSRKQAIHEFMDSNRERE